VETPKAVLDYIRKVGSKTSESASQSWRIDGAWGTIKVQTASFKDLQPDQGAKAVSEITEKFKNLPRPQIQYKTWTANQALSSSTSRSGGEVPVHGNSSLPENTEMDTHESGEKDLLADDDDLEDNLNLEQVPLSQLKRKQTSKKTIKHRKSKPAIQVCLVSKGFENWLRARSKSS